MESVIVGLSSTSAEGAKSSWRLGLEGLQPRRRRTSVRNRPPDAMRRSHDRPRPAADHHPGPPPMSRKSKMSLFSMFSRPKVERQRGYVEQGLVLHSHDETADMKEADTPVCCQSPALEPPRSTSSLSFRSDTLGSTWRGLSSRVSSRALRSPREPSVWEPPPLFQAFPQSSKHGLVPVASGSTETVLGKAKAGRRRGLEVPLNRLRRVSVELGDSGAAPRPTIKGGSHDFQHELERKVVVLLSSGYLLQYSEHGPSGRLPERILVLGEDSAVYASDMIPGQPFVLQVAQAVDDQGLDLSTSEPLLSRISSRSANARGTIANIWLILPNAREMDSWLHAVRRQIETSKVERAKSDACIDERLMIDGDREQDVAASPAYARNRFLHGGSSHAVTAQQSAPSLNSSSPPRAAISPDSPAKPSSRSMEEDQDFAAMLTKGSPYVRPQTSRARSPSLTPSISSSIGQSLYQDRQDGAKSSTHRLSTISNLTTLTSRTNSLTSESASNKPSMDSTGFRSLASYASHGHSKRRSVVPSVPLIVQPTPETEKLHQISAAALRPAVTDNLAIGLRPMSPMSQFLQTKQSLPTLSEQPMRPDSKIDLLTIDAQQPQPSFGDIPFLVAKDKPVTKSVQRMSSAPALNIPRSAPKRLSFFPPPQAIPPNQPVALIKRSSVFAPESAGRSNNSTALKRPFSIQIRTTSAPFTSSLRSSPVESSQTRSFTPPIRSLKPSRASLVPTTAPRPPIKDVDYQPASRSTMRSPSPSIPHSKYARASVLTCAPPPRHICSSPALDYGFPAVALGEPAPPPTAPLPAPPLLAKHDRPCSPPPMQLPVPTTPLPSPPRSMGAASSAAGLGITVP